MLGSLLDKSPGKVSVKDKFVASIGIKASVLEGFSQTSVRVIRTKSIFLVQIIIRIIGKYI